MKNISVCSWSYRLSAARVAEDAWLAEHGRDFDPENSEWDKWGGWADGPQLEATGGFRTTKWNGKWWIVDPDGHLWWSHGPVRVTPSCATTALDGHEDWFARLPAKDEPESEFYSTRDQLLFPYYARWKMHKIYDFEKRFGYPMCVGCGRCDDICPEYISYSNLVNRLAKEEQ